MVRHAEAKTTARPRDLGTRFANNHAFTVVGRIRAGNFYLSTQISFLQRNVG